MRTYYADATFTFALQSGAWPDCNADYGQATADLQAALAATAPWDFTYADPRGWDVTCTLTYVTAPLPCGAMDPTCTVAGMVAWKASAPPWPDHSWDLGQQLSGRLAQVPVVSQGLTLTVSLASLWVRESAFNPPGALWPQPAGDGEPAGEASNA